MGSKSLVGLRRAPKKVDMILLLLIAPILGLPIGTFIHDVVNRTTTEGHDLAFNIEQFRNYPGRILSPINKGESEFALVSLNKSLIVTNKLCHLH